MSRRLLIILFLLGGGCLVSGCVNNSAQPPQMLQVCLSDDDADSLIAILERVARENDMAFVDRSRQSRQELSRLGKDPGYRVVNVSASRSDGLGVAAGNLGLGAREIAIGVTNGSDPSDGNVLFHALLTELKSKWEVSVVPAGRGAVPSGKCRSS